MTNIVGVRFKLASRVRFFDPGNFDLNVGDFVVVETGEGERTGQVVISPRQVLYTEKRDAQNPVIRKVEAS